MRRIEILFRVEDSSIKDTLIGVFLFLYSKKDWFPNLFSHNIHLVQWFARVAFSKVHYDR